MARKYKVKITGSGFIYIVITILISVAAINTGNNLLYIISSLLLALMALSGAVSLSNLLFIELSVKPSDEIFAFMPARFRITVNKRLGGSFFLTIDTSFGSLPLPYIKKGSEQVCWLKFPVRGRVLLDNLQIHSGFPLGFFRRFKNFPLGQELLVYPRPVMCLLPAPRGGIQGTEKCSDSFYGELGDEIKELRTYRHCDPLRWVDWKATARRGKMVVKEFYRLEGDTLDIDLSVKGDSWEERLSQASYLVLEGQRRKLLVGLRLPDKEIQPGNGEKHKRLLLEALALA